MKTNLLIIHNSMDGGGAERVLATILRNFDRKLFNITLLLIFKTGVFLESVPDDVQVLYLFPDTDSLPTKLTNHFSNIRNYIWERRARRLLQGKIFDVTVSFMEGTAAKMHSMLLDLAPRNMTWVHINLSLGRWYGFWFKRKEEEQFYRRVDKIAFVSNEARDVFSSMFRTEAHLEVIHNPVDPVEIISKGGDNAKPADKAFTIINVGRLVRQKRQDRLIKAASILKDRGCQFKINILGTGELEQELKALSAQLGTEDCVNFAGFINNPYQWMKQSDVFCLTSQTEGFPMVIAEALTLNLPIVSTRATGVAEQICHGGGIFTTDEPEDIADKLEYLMTRPYELARLKAETQIAARHLSLESIMAQITDYITR